MSLERRVLVLGTGREATRFQEAWRQSAPLRWTLAGFAGDAGNPRIGPVLGRVDQLSELIKETGPTDVVVALPGLPPPECAGALLRASESGIRVAAAATFAERMTGRVPLVQLEQVWASALGTPDPRRRRYLRAKRWVDVAVAGVALVAVSLVALPVVLASKLVRRGPVFQREERIGQYGRPFGLLRLRTRRLGLSRIPPLLNVLRGDMSLVGPSPESPDAVVHQAREVPACWTRTLVKPGVVGWGRLRQRRDARCMLDTLRRLEYDLYYVKHASLALDLSTVVETIGAYRGAASE
jgi:lipopolysaccharide/colanic/teichoic acid biosynthesis glycosyltransferase